MAHLWRIIDANLNRAAEAMRVLEDLARFALDRADLALVFKHARHELRNSAGRLAPPGVLIAHRDVGSDVGTQQTADGEYERADTPAIAEANAARLGEALRAIEEAAKGLGAQAPPLERLRYQTYEASQRLIAALGYGRRRQWTLCVLLTESLCAGRPWLQVAADAIEGGADCLQLREKSLPDRELADRARALVALAHPRGAQVILNDRADIALACGVDGVHVGQSDLSVAEVRCVAGRTLIVGVSTANLAQAQAAYEAGADYCGVGPMFPTTTKHKPELAGPEYLRAYLAAPGVRGVPHLAIGGITPENAGVLAGAGCRGVAVSSAVCGAPDPRAAAAQLVAALAPAPAVRA